MHSPRLKLLILVFLPMLILLASCGSEATNSAPEPTQPGTQPTTAPTPTPTPTPEPAKSAEQITTSLKDAGLPIGIMFVYTEENDQNNLLGRPGQYTGKVNFIDTRTNATNTGVDITVRDGGSVETFANTADAQKRFDYLQGLSTSGNALFAEYEYLQGTAILRVSSQLTPTQAKEYEAAFLKAVG